VRGVGQISGVEQKIVTRKSTRVAAMVEAHRGQKLDPHYAGYFHCFNHQKFYEAHDVLEHIWLPDKHGPNGAFYKGLIQLAGAFVHLQKNRLKPSAALFKLARTNLSPYPAVHDGLNVERVRLLIEHWLGELEGKNFEVNPLTAKNAPHLALEGALEDK
jgi:predicted metal-dependent hydrolase